MASKKNTPAEQGKSISDQNLADYVANLPDDKKLQLIQIIKEDRIETIFSGPLPSPDDFKKYSEVLPNAPERIMSMAEKEQQIRADGQAGMLANDRRRINGSMMIGMSLIAVAALATWLGHAHIALPIGLAGVFVALIRQILNWGSQRQ